MPDSEKMTLETAIELLLLEADVGEGEISEARGLVLSQDDPVEIVFSNCDIGENGYENEMMRLAKELVVDDEVVIESIAKAYANSRVEQRLYIEYCIAGEEIGGLGKKILDILGVDIDQYEFDIDCWNAVFYGGPDDTEEFFYSEEDGHFHPVPDIEEVRARREASYHHRALKRIFADGLDPTLQTKDYIDKIIAQIQAEDNKYHSEGL